MTTKYKIIGGFLLMILLMGGIATLAFRDLGDASSRFLDYRRFARMNVYTSDLLVNLGAAGTQANAYLLSHDPKALEASLQVLNDMEKIFENALNESRVPENIQLLNELRKLAGTYRNGLMQLTRAVDDSVAQYANTVTPNGLAMVELMRQLAEQAESMNNVSALAAVSHAWEEYALLLSALGRFSNSRSETDMKTVDMRVEKLNPLLQKIGAQLVTSEGRAIFGKLQAAADNVVAAVGNMKANARTANEQAIALDGIRDTFTNELQKLSSRIDEQMRELGLVTIEENEGGQRNLLIMGLTGTLIGLLVATFIIFGLIRVLRELGAFAKAISDGDFSYKINTRERGEIGNMIEAMKHIPAVLEEVIASAGNASAKIQIGFFRERLDEQHFTGEYMHLAHGINAVSDAYTKTLDSLPLSIMTADKEHRIIFQNPLAQSVAGGIATGKKREDVLQGVNAKIEKTGPNNVPSEISVDSEGQRKIFTANSLPMIDSSGATVGMMEILNDITQIREQQALMLNVANQASEISNRVAAASEELAAQVEQVSRGAEMQRERIDSTASAMTEMNATVLEVARSAGSASEQSEATRLKATEGSDLVNKVMGAINEVNSVGQNLQVNMQELGSQAESIGNVMNVISDIADQTNLLALNAAIEAARAGEAGRGFAVVADEVRKLAEKTMQATQEVGSSISAVQSSTRVNIEEVGKAVASVAEANELAQSSGLALREIVQLASANSSVVASIATAAEEQSATSEEISRAIDQINQVVGETTEGMVQSSAAVQDLSRMAQELRRVMEGLQ